MRVEKAALIHGVTAGRHGFGSIYIVASGNGGAEGKENTMNIPTGCNSA